MSYCDTVQLRQHIDNVGSVRVECMHALCSLQVQSLGGLGLITVLQKVWYCYTAQVIGRVPAVFR